MKKTACKTKRKEKQTADPASAFACGSVYFRTSLYDGRDCIEKSAGDESCAGIAKAHPVEQFCKSVGYDRLSEKICQYTVYYACKSDIYCIYKCNGILCNCKKQKKEQVF